MDTNESVSGLGEALASYQPSSMPAATWARFREDAVALVCQLDLRDERDGRQRLSRLAIFAADIAEARPEATLEDLLTKEQVEGHLHRSLASSTAPGTVQNRQATLNALLELQAGKRGPARRSPERHLAPYGPQVLPTVMRTAMACGAEGGEDLVRAIVAGLVCGRLPTWRCPDAVEVTIAGRTASAGGHERDFGDQWELPTSGVVDCASLDRARAWARGRLEFSLDARRLELTAFVGAVRSRPALEIIQQGGLGRDRLTAAVDALGPIPLDELRRHLRTPGEDVPRI